MGITRRTPSQVQSQKGSFGPRSSCRCAFFCSPKLFVGGHGTGLNSRTDFCAKPIPSPPHICPPPPIPPQLYCHCLPPPLLTPLNSLHCLSLSGAASTRRRLVRELTFAPNRSLLLLTVAALRAALHTPPSVHAAAAAAAALSTRRHLSSLLTRWRSRPHAAAASLSRRGRAHCLANSRRRAMQRWGAAAWGRRGALQLRRAAEAVAAAALVGRVVRAWARLVRRRAGIRLALLSVPASRTSVGSAGGGRSGAAGGGGGSQGGEEGQGGGDGSAAGTSRVGEGCGDASSPRRFLLPSALLPFSSLSGGSGGAGARSWDDYDRGDDGGASGASAAGDLWGVGGGGEGYWGIGWGGGGVGSAGDMRGVGCLRASDFDAIVQLRRRRGGASNLRAEAATLLLAARGICNGFSGLALLRRRAPAGPPSVLSAARLRRRPPVGGAASPVPPPVFSITGLLVEGGGGEGVVYSGPGGVCSGPGGGYSGPGASFFGRGCGGYSGLGSVLTSLTARRRALITWHVWVAAAAGRQLLLRLEALGQARASPCLPPLHPCPG